MQVFVFVNPLGTIGSLMDQMIGSLVDQMIGSLVDQMATFCVNIWFIRQDRARGSLKPNFMKPNVMKLQKLGLELYILGRNNEHNIGIFRS